MTATTKSRHDRQFSVRHQKPANSTADKMAKRGARRETVDKADGDDRPQNLVTQRPERRSPGDEAAPIRTRPPARNRENRRQRRQIKEDPQCQPRGAELIVHLQRRQNGPGFCPRIAHAVQGGVAKIDRRSHGGHEDECQAQLLRRGSGRGRRSHRARASLAISGVASISLPSFSARSLGASHSWAARESRHRSVISPSRAGGR